MGRLIDVVRLLTEERLRSTHKYTANGWTKVHESQATQNASELLHHH